MNHPFLITEKGKLTDRNSSNVEELIKLTTKEVRDILDKIFSPFKAVK
jgi:hypothetical protein